jgi:chromosomal replication initiation ATPase DnaA
MYLYINYTSFSMAKIGWICGNKDHATVLNARKAVSSMRLTNHKNINYHIDKLNELLAA